MHADHRVRSLPESMHAGVTRRRLVRGAAGLAFGSGVANSLSAQETEDGARLSAALPLPIAHIAAPGLHFFFAGPVEGTAVATDPEGAHPDGRDPSTITNFNGFIGQVDLNFSGTGTDLETGAQSPYDFHTDTRFMQGTFVGSDERPHFGTFGFI